MEKEMRDELEIALSYSADKYTSTTVYVKMNVQALDRMIGEIQNVSVDEKGDIDRYTKFITSINPISDTNAWIKTLSDEYAKLLKRTGEEVKTMNTPCDDIIVMSSGECIISVLARDEKLIKTIDIKPLLPARICWTENDDILVALMDNDDTLNVSPTSRRIVQRIARTGKVLHTYEFTVQDCLQCLLVQRRTKTRTYALSITSVLTVEKLSYYIAEMESSLKSSSEQILNVIPSAISY